MLQAPGASVVIYGENAGEPQALVGSRPPPGERKPEGAGAAAPAAGSPAVEYRAAWAGEGPMRPLATVPLRHGRQPIGLLVVCESDGTGAAVVRSDAQLLELFAARAAGAIDNLRLFEQVRNSRQRLQALSRQLLAAQETERRHIARELHDEVGQSMTVAQLNLQAIDPLVSDPAARALLEDTRLTIEQVLQQVRDLSLSLRPSLLDDFGLVAALKWLVNRQAQRAGIAIELAAEPLETRLPPEIETVCFRVAQEALTNIVRHAHARHVRLELKRSRGKLQMVIQDDGGGFDLPHALKRVSAGESFGLLGMQERAVLVGGRIEIETAPARGTIIRMYFPLDTNNPYVERRARRRSHK